MNDESCNALCKAIMVQAIKDWLICRKAEDNKRKLPKWFGDNRETIEAFFKSDYGMDITDTDGEVLVEKLNKYYDDNGGEVSIYGNK